MIAIEVFCEDSIACISLDATVLDSAKGLILCPATARHQGTQCVSGFFCQDVDNAVRSVGSPYSGAGSANYFNPVNVLHRNILGVPIGASGNRRINSPAIYHNEQFVATLLV